MVKIEALKVGDRLRYLGDQDWGDQYQDAEVAGTTVSHIDGKPAVRLKDGGLILQHQLDDWELISSELEELRAWKAAAIAKHPDLEPPAPLTVTISGPQGAGKTQLAAALARVVQNHDGILPDDHLAGSWDSGTLRAAITGRTVTIIEGE